MTQQKPNMHTLPTKYVAYQLPNSKQFYKLSRFNIQALLQSCVHPLSVKQISLLLPFSPNIYVLYCNLTLYGLSHVTSVVLPIKLRKKKALPFPPIPSPMSTVTVSHQHSLRQIDGKYSIRFLFQTTLYTAETESLGLPMLARLNLATCNHTRTKLNSTRSSCKPVFVLKLVSQRIYW